MINQVPAATVTIADTDKEDGSPRRPASDPQGPTGRLATWLADTTFDDIPGTR
jgi:hypothetical protein